MSNQVYSNSTRKYWAQPGVTVWSHAVSQTITKADGSTDITFAPAPTVNQGSGAFMSYNAATDTFTVNESGMYSLNLIARMKKSAPAEDWSYDVGLQIESGDLFQTSVIYQKGAVPANEADDIFVGGSVVMFLKNTTQFKCFFTNYSTPTSLILPAPDADGGTKLITCKVL